MANSSVTASPKQTPSCKNSSVFTKDTNKTLPNLNPSPDIIQPITVTAPGIAKLLHNLKPTKALGPHNILNNILKTLADTIAPSVIVTFQSSPCALAACQFTRLGLLI